MTAEIGIKHIPDLRIKPSRVMMGISGGVDSSVAALLMKRNNIEVIGMTMITNDDGFVAAEDAAAVCRSLGIKHIVVDVREEFSESIIRDFVYSYTSGRTPNPCIKCNPSFKFRLLYELAYEFDCDGVATGHYANIACLSNGRYAMERAPVGFKDQSYFLSRLSQDQLKRLHFPLGTYNKSQVRDIAIENGLTTSDGSSIGHKPDSQDNCFIPDNYSEFIQGYLQDNDPELLYLTKPGKIIDVQGNVIGQHKGLINYTIGQRKGFEVKTTERLFVIGRDIKENILKVGAYENVLRESIEISDIVYSGLPATDEPISLEAKIRHSAREADCTVSASPNSEKLIVQFKQLVAAPVAGQSCVLYHNGAIMASGYIDDSFN